MGNSKKTSSILIQVAILFLIGALLTGVLSYLSQNYDSAEKVKEQMEDISANVVVETEMALKEYPAYEWLVKYWYEHYENMDIEYDAGYGEGTITEIKCNTWNQRHPDIPIRYATAEELDAVDAVDQKLYAEIAYSWLITRIDQIKQANDVSFLFCVLPNETFDSQFFLFSGAEPDSIRGTSYEEVYPLGVTVKVAESQQNAMVQAINQSSFLVEAGEYMDYYANIGVADGHPILVGITYDVSSLVSAIKTRARHNTEFAVAFQIIVSLLCLGIIYVFALKPLKKVQTSIRRYTDTKDSAEIAKDLSTVPYNNEIKALATDVTELAEEIDNYTCEIENITKERERIGAELDLASRIQASVLPSDFPAFPDRNEFEIFASMNPAKEVGGDFYDFFFVDDDHLCLAIADVSGKGIPGALFMMASKILLENNAMMKKNPAKLLMDMNNSIVKKNHEEMFITVWLGILEVSTGRLTAANAGHEYPVIMKAGGEFELLKDKHGFVLGGMEDLPYTEYELQMNPGDKLFVYTDGVPEATSADNELFGTERMVEALNQVKDESPEGILGGVQAAIDGFVKEAEQFDDLTMMCITYKG